MSVFLLDNGGASKEDHMPTGQSLFGFDVGTCDGDKTGDCWSVQWGREEWQLRWWRHARITKVTAWEVNVAKDVQMVGLSNCEVEVSFQ